MADAPKKGSGGKKKVKGHINLVISPGAASPSPPVGPALGQKGVNIMDFCKKFNEATKGMDAALAVAVQITVFEDRSFTFTTKKPLASKLVARAVGGPGAALPKGSAVPNREKIGMLTRQQLETIAKVKMPDLTAAGTEAALRTIAGTARSMGVDIDWEK